MREQDEKAFQNVLDCFGGRDGGGRFVQFKVFLEDFSDRAASGDTNADELMSIVRHFSNMIDVANKR